MPTIAEAVALAIQRQRAGRLQEAEQILGQILAVDPNHADALNLLGVIASQTGRNELAEHHIRRAIQLKGSASAFHYTLGVVLQTQRKLDDAIQSYCKAIALNPNYVEAHSNLGGCFHSQGRLEEAARCYVQAVELKPELVEGHYNLGTVLVAQRRLSEAVGCFRRALELKPDFARAYYDLGSALSDLGLPDEAIAAYQRALEVKPDYADAYSNVLVAMQYMPDVTLAGLLAAHREFDHRFAAPLREHWRPHENDRDPERRLRVGFVSPNFFLLPAIGYFVIRALENLDRAQCETVCYCDWNLPDDATQRFRAAASEWRNVTALTDEELTEQIRADRIDILFDLAGQTAQNRLLVFARKPAPIQVTWGDYVGTTGLAAMDYILADRYEIPAEAEKYYCERVLRMPDDYICYDPPAYAPDVSPLPALTHGIVAFGSFNYPAKITSQIVAVWAKIVFRVPQSRLVLKYRGMNDVACADRLAKEFGSLGIDRERVEFQGWSPHEALLADYGRIDVALDTFAYNGGLTTCEALWMGVPVVTCPGETFASRHSLSHLSNAGLTETIGGSLNEYVEIAVSLAGDMPRLAKLRVNLRQQMAVSPLCDGPRYAKNLMANLRDVWREWCQRSGS